MSKLTVLLGGLLIALGILSYAATSGVSVTALIPAFFGLPLAVLGFMALKKEDLRRHFMHAAAALALLGFAGSVGAVRFALYMVSVGPAHIENPAAVIARTLMALLCGGYLYFSIRSFIEARRNRLAGTSTNTASAD